MILKKSILYLPLLFLTGYFTQWDGKLYGNQIGVLPSIVTGMLSKKDFQKKNLNYSKEFAMLSKEIIENQYLASVSTIDIDSYSLDFLNICNQMRADYVLRDNFTFSPGLSPYIHSSLVNCKTRVKSEKESKLSGYAINSIQNHYKNLFQFLPRRELNYPKPNALRWSIQIFIDANGSMSYEKTNLENWIFQPKGGGNSYFLTFMSQNQELFSQSTNQNKLDLPFRSYNNFDAVISGLNRFVIYSPPGFEKNLQVIILSPSQLSNPGNIINIINRGRQVGKTTIIIASAISSNAELHIYQKIANTTQSDIIYPRIKQRIGLESGKIGTLSLYRGYLRWELDSLEIKYPNEGNISPYSMADSFASFYGEKVVQKGEIESNLTLELDEHIEKFKNPSIHQSRRILVQAHGKASWITIQQNTKFTVGENYILETVFYPDPNSTSGISNHPYSTKLHKSNWTYPLLLEYDLEEISRIIQKYKLSELKSYIQVSVLEGN